MTSQFGAVWASTDRGAMTVYRGPRGRHWVVEERWIVPHSLRLPGCDEGLDVLAINFTSCRVVVRRGEAFAGFEYRAGTWFEFDVTFCWYDPILDSARFGGRNVRPTSGPLTIVVRKPEVVAALEAAP